MSYLPVFALHATNGEYVEKGSGNILHTFCDYLCMPSGPVYITQYSIPNRAYTNAMAKVEHESDIELTEDTPIQPGFQGQPMWCLLQQSRTIHHMYNI